MKSWIVGGRSSGDSFAQGATSYVLIGGSAESDQLATTRVTLPEDLTARRLAVRCGANTLSGNCVVTLFKNGTTDTALAVTFATGEADVEKVIVADVAFLQDDDWVLKVACDAGTGAITLLAYGIEIEPDNSASTLSFFAAKSASSSALVAAGTSFFAPFGVRHIDAVEVFAGTESTGASWQSIGAFTAIYFQIATGNNDWSGTVTARTRKNEGNGGSSISVGGGDDQTVLVDTTGETVLADGDEFNYSVELGAGSGTMNVESLQCWLRSAAGQFLMAIGDRGGLRINAGLTRYWHLQGEGVAAHQTEAPSQLTAPFNMTVVHLQVMSDRERNTSTASPVTLHVDGVASALSYSIPASGGAGVAFGIFEDSDDVAVSAGELLSTEFVTGDGTNRDWNYVVYLVEAAVSTVLPWDEDLEGTGFAEAWSGGAIVDGSSTLNPDASSTDVNSPPGWGSQCLRMAVVAPDNDAHVDHAFAADEAEAWGQVEFILQTDALAADSGFPIVLWFDAAPSPAFVLGIGKTAGGQLVVQANFWHDGTQNAFELAIEAGKRYRVQWKWDRVADLWEWRVDHEFQDGGAITGGAPGALRIMQLGTTDVAAQGSVVYFDNYRVGASAYPAIVEPRDAPGSILTMSEGFEGTGYENSWILDVDASNALDPDADPADVGTPSGWDAQCLKMTIGATDPTAFARLVLASSLPVAYIHEELVVSDAASMANDTAYTVLVTKKDYPTPDNAPFAAYVFKIAGVLNLFFAAVPTAGVLRLSFLRAIVEDVRYVLELKWDSVSNYWQAWVDGVLLASGCIEAVWPQEVNQVIVGSSGSGTARSVVTYIDQYMVSPNGFPVALAAGGQDIHVPGGGVVTGPVDGGLLIPGGGVAVLEPAAEVTTLEINVADAIATTDASSQTTTPLLALDLAESVTALDFEQVALTPTEMFEVDEVVVEDFARVGIDVAPRVSESIAVVDVAMISLSADQALFEAIGVVDAALVLLDPLVVRVADFVSVTDSLAVEMNLAPQVELVSVEDVAFVSLDPMLVALAETVSVTDSAKVRLTLPGGGAQIPLPSSSRYRYRVNAVTTREQS